jgi:hypothetical protein
VKKYRLNVKLWQGREGESGEGNRKEVKVEKRNPPSADKY